MEPTAVAQVPAGTSSTGISGSAAEAQEIESPATQQTPNKLPFTATFSNGVQAQLVGMSENPSQGSTWWTPNGTPLEKAPYARVPAIMHPSKGYLAREICWRWLNLPDDPDFETDWQVLPHPGGCGGGIPFDTNGKRIEGLTAWAIIPKSQDDCTLRLSVSISATPWRTLFTSDGRLSATSRIVDGVNHGVVFGKPYAEKDGTSITVSYEIPGKDVRVVAYGADGLPDVGVSKGGAGSLAFSQTTYHYAGLPPEKIVRFDFQIQQRQFESIEFRNVSLYPDKRTDVKIVRIVAEPENRQPSAGVISPALRAGGSSARSTISSANTN
jgi:hypothetical protein